MYLIDVKVCDKDILLNWYIERFSIVSFFNINITFQKPGSASVWLHAYSVGPSDEASLYPVVAHQLGHLEQCPTYILTHILL
jgi:hypothetical protein